MIGAHLVVENLGRGAGQRAEPGALQFGRAVPAREMPSVAAPCEISSGENAWMCMSGHRVLDGAADRQIGRRRYSRGWMPPCRQTSVAPRVPGFAAAALDLVERRGRRAGRAGARCVLPLEKAQNCAAVGADVGVVDVAGDDVADALARGLAAQRIGRGADLVEARRRARRTARRSRASLRPRPAMARSRIGVRRPAAGPRRGHRRRRERPRPASRPRCARSLPHPPSAASPAASPESIQRDACAHVSPDRSPAARPAPCRRPRSRAASRSSCGHGPSGLT